MILTSSLYWMSLWIEALNIITSKIYSHCNVTMFHLLDIPHISHVYFSPVTYGIMLRTLMVCIKLKTIIVSALIIKYIENCVLVLGLMHNITKTLIGRLNSWCKPFSKVCVKRHRHICNRRFNRLAIFGKKSE